MFQEVLADLKITNMRYELESSRPSATTGSQCKSGPNKVGAFGQTKGRLLLLTPAVTGNTRHCTILTPVFCFCLVHFCKYLYILYSYIVVWSPATYFPEHSLRCYYLVLHKHQVGASIEYHPTCNIFLFVHFNVVKTSQGTSD